jgi:hypothetical protein
VQGFVNLADENGGACILGRVQSNSQYYQLELKKDTSAVKKWWLWKNNSGTWTQIAAGNYTFVANSYYLLRLEMNGSSLTAKVSTDYGVNFTTLGSGTDTTFISGKIGVRGWGTVCMFDDVKVVSF